MHHSFFAIVFYIPLYNALIAIVSVLPDKSVGLGVILLTIIVRLILFPLSRQTIKAQLQMKQIEPEVQKIKDTYKDRQEQSKKLMELYKDKDINPLAGLLLIIIQLPIVIELYQVFRSSLPYVDHTILYHFLLNAINVPASVSMAFFGIDLLHKSILLAIFAVITQFIQLNLSLPKQQKKKGDPSFKKDLAYSMNMQMKYIFPLIIFPIAYLSSVLGLYLSASNVFMILQELFVRRKMEKQYAAKAAASKNLNTSK